MSREDNMVKRFFFSTAPLLIVSAALFAIVFAARTIVNEPGATVTLLFVFPISLLAIRFGPKGGLCAAFVALALYALGPIITDTSVPPLGYFTRALSFFVIGGGLGYIASAAKMAEARSERLYEMSIDLLCIARLSDGVFLSVNPAFERVTGYSREELTSTPFIEFVHPDDIEKTARESALLGQSDYETVSFENRYRTKSGEYIWLEWRSRSVLSEGLIYAGAREVTERKQIERQREQTRRDALEATRLKSQFLANMSHEIRTPLNGIIGMAELMSDTRLDEEQVEYLDAVRASGNTLLVIVNDILDFSRIEAGKLELESTDFDLRDLVEEVCSTVSPQALDSDVELLSWIDDELPVIARGDANRLRQVLTNLVGNAVKFTDDGEVLVRVQSTGEVNGSASARFEVRDTGIGIAPEAQGHLFESFRQADATTTRRFGGTGLGLAISKQLVELMGGEIGLESELGIGSTFFFTIPLEVTSLHDRRGDRAELTGLHVVIVDDNATNRAILEHQFESWGMTSKSAENGDQALERLHAAVDSGMPYELALIDLNMPGMDGIELARRIRSTPSLRTLRMMILSSSGFSRADATAAGIAGFITKPIRQSRLYDEISRVMGSGTVPARDQADQHTIGDGGHVLIAEDNPINQTVAKRLLEKRGCRVDVAANGREAVAMSGRIDYAAIFMDCQMPILDGYQASREIRAREYGGPTTPIIAMTANTMKGERERCIDAGMSDYLAKPITPNKLDPMLEHWIGSATVVPGTQPPVETDEPAQAVASVEQLTEKFGVPTDLVVRLANSFVGQAPELIAEMRAALLAGDLEPLGSLAHKLRGSCLNMGAAVSAELAGEIEQAAQRGDAARCDERLTVLGDSIVRVVALVELNLRQEAA